MFEASPLPPEISMADLIFASWSLISFLLLVVVPFFSILAVSIGMLFFPDRLFSSPTFRTKLANILSPLTGFFKNAYLRPLAVAPYSVFFLIFAMLATNVSVLAVVVLPL